MAIDICCSGFRCLEFYLQHGMVQLESIQKGSVSCCKSLSRITIEVDIPKNQIWRHFEDRFFSTNLHSRKLTWHPKIDTWKRRFLLETIILRLHVSFRECTICLEPHRSPHEVLGSTWSGLCGRVSECKGGDNFCHSQCDGMLRDVHFLNS